MIDGFLPRAINHKFQYAGEKMTNRKSIASVLLFVGCTLCFFLPFVTVSCQGTKVFTLTGQQLATGTTVKEPVPFGPPKEQKIEAHPLAAIAGLCALAGVGLCLVGQRMSIAAAVTGGAGAISLVVMKSQLTDQLQKRSMGVAQTNAEIGYTLALLLFTAGAAWSLYLFFRGRMPERADNPSHSCPSPAVPSLNSHSRES